MNAKNRGWVKNVAIIFLAVLLVLTFFSNTIMNRSLPEVSVQQAYGGEIATALRGSGMVVANEAYTLEIDQTREIKRILVREGDIIEAGQAVIELEPTDSAELKDAIKQLENMQYDYNIKLLGILPNDDRLLQLEIQDLQDALNEAIEARDKAAAAQIDHDNARDAEDKARFDDTAAQNRVTVVEEEIAMLQVQLDELVVEVDVDLLDGNMKTLWNAVLAAQTNLKQAQEYLTSATASRIAAQGAYNDAVASGPGATPPPSVPQVVEDAQDAYDAAVDAEIATAATAIAAAKAEFASFLAGGEPVEGDDEYAAYQAYLRYQANETKANMTALFNELLNVVGMSNLVGIPEITAWKASVDDVTKAKTDLDDAKVAAGIDNGNAASDHDAYVAQLLQRLRNAENAERSAQNSVTIAETNLETAQNKFDTATKDIEIAGKKERQLLQEQMKQRRASLKTAQDTAKRTGEALAKAIENTAKAAQEAAVTPEMAEKSVKEAQKTLERRLISIDIESTSEAAQSSITNIGLQRDRDAIAEQEATVAKLREKEGSTEITTRYGGTVLSIDVVAGEKVNSGEALMQIEINGKGYTMTVSVTNEETRRVRVGDIATINSYGMSDVVCTLVAIKTDRDDPTRKKLLEFELTGSVTAGQNLDIMVGTRTQYFESVLPSSAIREDADGKFVLVAASKQTPLGTRYIAERVDVTVIEFDTQNSAVSADFGDTWAVPYVITRVSKPVEAGTQVRLAA